METDITISIAPEHEKSKNFIEEEIYRHLKKKGIAFPKNKEDVTFVFQKKSIDARRKNIKLVLRYKVYIGEKPDLSEISVPEWKRADPSKSVVIVGSGPSGLFAALKLLEKGIKPIIIERGSPTSQRRKDIAKISREGLVSSDSNYCFGEGGAGTFSDGKLYTRSDKRGSISSILKTFVFFGADPKILTDAHPHIGTEKLPAIINAMNEKICQLGGEIDFDTRCKDFIIQEKSGEKIVIGIQAVNTLTGEEKEFRCDALILATGHSAVELYETLANIDPSALEAKGFAVGVRVEHPRELIDTIQYHGSKQENLGTAEYRLTCQQDGRGVYSFCMCPGGFVVPSATAPEQIVVNGMSTASRNSPWSNSAIVVETRVEDIPPDFIKEAEAKKVKPLAGLYWRTFLEHTAFLNGDKKSQKAPSQLLSDFLSAKDSVDLPRSSYAPGLVPSRLDLWLPAQISDRMKKAFLVFDKSMKGFICKEALVLAIETRTSTPVRILRDKVSGQSPVLKNLYPAGEGSGYSGGIVSSAMDGQNQAAKIIEAFTEQR